MKTFKKFFRKIDLFGVPLLLKYKSKDNYTTSLGGLTLFLFILIALYSAIYYCIKFIRRENFTTIYYIVNIPKAESVNLKKANGFLA